MNREEELVEKIKALAFNYYETGNSAEDSEFNALEDELRAINPNNTILTTPGYGYEFKGLDNNEKFEHPWEVGSIQKEKDIHSLCEWIGSHEFTVSSKLDGNSIALYYKNKKFWKAVTRGVKNIGIDRTIKFVDIVPKTIPFDGYICVRGEAVISKEDYKAFDQNVSSRNVVAGAIARKDDWKGVMNHVKFIAYTFYDITNNKDIYSEEWKNVFDCELQKEETKDFLLSVDDLKKNYIDDFPFEADGVVVKRDDGEMLAFKFEAEKRMTKVTGVEISVGNDQRLTPVYTMEPVVLSGATIKKASLGSFGKAINLGVWPIYDNEIVEVERANEIIPHITRLVSKGNNIIVDSVIRCPVCGQKGAQIGEHYFCLNDSCENIMHSKMMSFSKFFSPKGLAEKMLEKVFASMNIKSVFDLGEKKFSDYTPISDSLDEKVKMFFENLEKGVDSKIIYQVFLTSCGKEYAEDIVQTVDWKTVCENSITPIIENKLRGLCGFRESLIGELIIHNGSFVKLDKLFSVFDAKKSEIKGTFCVTGMRFTKDQLYIFEKNGWVEDTTVKKTTTVLVVKDKNATSSKIKAAEKNGIKIMDMTEFVKFVIV